MRSGQMIGKMVAGGVAGALALGMFMLPRRKRSSLMRRGLKFWSRGSHMMMKRSRIFH